MTAEKKTVKDILANIPPDRSPAFQALHETILKSLPEGFVPAVSFGGLWYVVPHAVYPQGYHCNPAEPLPLAGIASQKNTINLYHMGIYADPLLLKWFTDEYPKHCRQKLDMGKSCIRFKKFDDIPLALIGALMKKITVEQWIEKYEAAFRPKPKAKTAKSKKA